MHIKLKPKKNSLNTEVVFERDDDGNPTKVARVGEVVELNQDNVKYLEKRGWEYDETSKSEAEEETPSPVKAAQPSHGGAENEPHGSKSK